MKPLIRPWLMGRVRAATDDTLTDREVRVSHCSDLAGARNLNLKEWGF